MQPDLRFWFDPVCPFAWLTSRWVEEVARQREYVVEYRLISLRLLNAHIDYDSHFPAGYEDGHDAGLHMLRVAAAARDAHGPEPLGALYTALGSRVWDVEPVEDVNAYRRTLTQRPVVEAALAEAGLPTTLAAAVDDPAWDEVVQQDTDLALSLTGTDVGTPILQTDVPDGPGFFGPVISRVPDPQDAVRLWEHVVGLSTFPAFAELKRSLRAAPQLRVLGTLDQPVEEQDWHAGSRAADRPEGAGRPD
jgi:hypothetical protein